VEDCSAYDVLGEPDPAVGGDVDADAYVVEGCAGEVDAVPACWGFVDHAFLDGIDAAPRGRIGACKADAFTAVGELEAFVGDAGALIDAVWAGVTEAAVDHVPAMQACAGGECAIPDEGVESPDGAVMVD